MGNDCATSRGEISQPTDAKLRQRRPLSCDCTAGLTLQAVRTSLSDKPKWDEANALGTGANKDIYLGTFRGKTVAIAISRTTRAIDLHRIKKEISVFKDMGEHPHIISMLYSGFHMFKPYLVVEAVQPIGYDLSRMVNQYSWADLTVPSKLMAKICSQLASALGHMHSRNLLHRDLKTENVLITHEHNAKLIDFGIACEIGTIERLRSGYLAPELCDGIRPCGPEIDCWGLGVILHQAYQRTWAIVDIKVMPKVKPLKGRPSTAFMMDEMKDAMLGLLLFDPDERWTLQSLRDSRWFAGAPNVEEAGILKVLPGDRPAKIDHLRQSSSKRLYLRRYQSCQPPVSTYALRIGPHQTFLVGKRLADLDFGNKYKTVVLMVDEGKDNFKEIPGANTTLEEGHWIYFGMHPGGDTEEAHRALHNALFPEGTSKKKLSTGDLARSIEKKVGLLNLTLEFDCFTFPDHVGEEAAIGIGKLNIRKNFRINLAGVVRTHSAGSAEPEWFPDASVTVSAGDLGLVIRRPCHDGSTQPTVKDSDILDFMDPARFAKIIG